jgi:hypothetical protein
VNNDDREARFIVMIRFAGDPKKAKQVLDEDSRLNEAVRQGIYKHGMIRCRRLVGDGEFVDIDEWGSEEDRNAFVAAAGPDLAEWTSRAGITAQETHVWRPAAPDEVF